MVTSIVFYVLLKFLDTVGIHRRKENCHSKAGSFSVCMMFFFYYSYIGSIVSINAVYSSMYKTFEVTTQWQSWQWIPFLSYVYIFIVPWDIFSYYDPSADGSYKKKCSSFPSIRLTVRIISILKDFYIFLQKLIIVSALSLPPALSPSPLGIFYVLQHERHKNIIFIQEIWGGGGSGKANVKR